MYVYVYVYTCVHVALTYVYTYIQNFAVLRQNSFVFAITTFTGEFVNSEIAKV